MKELPLPIREVLGDALDEAATQRIWREVGRRRTQRATRSRVISPLLASAAALVLVLVGLWIWQGRALLATSDLGPLHLASGAELAFPQPSGDASTASAAPLDDGSHVTVFPGGRVAVLENSGRLVTLLLENGRARFQVKPGGPRRWTIECGVFSIEVVGTRFEVERTVRGARVSVDEGVVLVRGDRVQDRVQRLSAGDSLEMGPSDGPARSDVGASQEEPPLAPTSFPRPPLGSTDVHAVPASNRASAERTAPSAWHDHVQKGEYKEAYGLLGSEGLAQHVPRATLDELMQLADVARLSGHPADAVAPLSRVVSEHQGDSRAGMAAFTLGRLRLDQLGQPVAAANDFADALRLGLPSGLVEDAHARLVEARARAGDTIGAARAAAEYERKFPNGRRLATVRSWAPAE